MTIYIDDGFIHSGELYAALKRNNVTSGSALDLPQITIRERRFVPFYPPLMRDEPPTKRTSGYEAPGRSRHKKGKR